MCLITEDKTKYTALKNIVCYKLLNQNVENKSYQSTTYSFEWWINKLEKTKIAMKKHYQFLYNDYADSYSKDHYKDKEKELFIVEEGFHAYKTITRANKTFYIKYHILCKMIIPKGAKYYKDATGLIVSNKMILVGPV